MNRLVTNTIILTPTQPNGKLWMSRYNPFALPKRKNKTRLIYIYMCDICFNYYNGTLQSMIHTSNTGCLKGFIGLPSFRIKDNVPWFTVTVNTIFWAIILAIWMVYIRFVLIKYISHL